MKCPNCGADMPKGSLYCEQCGQDIQIVPDFEPEVELNIEKTISEIAEDIIKDGQDTYAWNNPVESPAIRKPKRRFKLGIILTVILICCVIAVAGGIFYCRYNSVEYQSSQAAKYMEEQEYDKAAKHYERALELSENDVVIMFRLAEVNFLKNNKIEYEYLLRRIVNSEEVTTDQIASAYGKLIAIYRARDDFKSVNELLLSSDNEEVMRIYQSYMALPPEFSIQEGFYTGIQPLKIIPYGTGKVYYTMDGSLPDENSAMYTAPIILEDGDYTICAYFVNEYGIASEYVTRSYHVVSEALPMPALSVVGGEYQFPINIEVLGDEEDVYYSTDGSTPTMASTPYSEPIPMPLGKTVFRFVRIKEGRTSEVVERIYTLTLNTEYTTVQAEQDVVAYILQSGRIYDSDGHFDGTAGMLKYRYQYVTNIDQVADFYVISEIYVDLQGNDVRTGNYYAVNAYTKELFKLHIDEYNNYTLIEIEGQSAR